MHESTCSHLCHRTWLAKERNAANQCIAGRWTSIWPEIGAHIAAVTLNGQDSRRAECGIVRRSRSVRHAFEVASDLQYDDCTEFNPKGVGLFR